MTQRTCTVYICDFCDTHVDDLGGFPIGWGLLQLDGHEDKDICPDCSRRVLGLERKRNETKGNPGP